MAWTARFVESIRLLRAKTLRPTPYSGEADATDRIGPWIEHAYPVAFQNRNEVPAAGRAAIVIAEHGEHGDPDALQQVASDLDLLNTAAVGDIPGDHQHVGAGIQE